jgi:hypothetical protein
MKSETLNLRSSGRKMDARLRLFIFISWVRHVTKEINSLVGIAARACDNLKASRCRKSRKLVVTDVVLMERRVFLLPL